MGFPFLALEPLSLAAPAIYCHAIPPQAAARFGGIARVDNNNTCRRLRLHEESQRGRRGKPGNRKAEHGCSAFRAA